MVALKKYIFAATMLMSCVLASGQQRTIIAGLEEHAEYCGLVAEEEALAHTADSISRSINALRASLRTDTSDRAANSAAILRMEQEGFDIRGRMARIASRINSIEQEWILENLYAGPAGGEGARGDEAPGSHSANLVFSSYFERDLGAAELHELRTAQGAETDVPRLVAQYIGNHGRMRALSLEYDAVGTEAAADSIRAGFEALKAVNAGLDTDVSERWEKIFDNKSYAYNYMMDKASRREMLARYESGMERLRGEKARWMGAMASDAIVNFVLEKRMLTDYEIALAGEFGNGAAADSLRRVAAALPRPEELEGLDPVRLKERLFLDYSDIRVGGVGQSPYNAANPIPEVRVFPKGVIYRVLTGTYSAAQSPSVFRGASPLAVQRGGDGKYRYFAGGFTSDSLADAAVERLRRAGFRSPATAVWMDGTYIGPATDGEGRFYRIELSGTEELPAGAAEIIGDGDIVRGEGGFIVTPLGREAAMRLRLALETLEGRDFEIKLAEISE